MPAASALQRTLATTRKALPTALVCLGAALAGWLVHGCVPAPLREPDQVLDRTALRLEGPRLVTPAQWLLLPRWHADFDLHFDLELGEHTECDLLLRQVEPRQFGAEFPQFHGRFTVLRLSSEREGPGWLADDAALQTVGEGGVRLTPGVLATVSVEGRGRLLRANVAGRWLPWQLADDVHGMTTLLVRGGKASVQNFVLQPRGLQAPWRWSAWCWMLLGLVLGLVQAAVVRPGGELAVAIGTLGTAWLLRAGLPGSPLAWPELGGMAAALGAAGLCGLLMAPGLGRARVLAGLVLLVLAVPVQRLAARPAPWREAQFGPASGAQPAEALGQRVRGPFGVQVLDPATPNVFLLGGQQLYDRGAPDQHLAALLGGELRGRLRRAVAVPCLPTVDGHAAQQWRLFERYYRAYRPAVVVLGVGRDEAALAHGRPRSSPAQLAAVVAAARQYCAEHGAGLVLCSDGDLPAELAAVLRQSQLPWVPWPAALAPQDAASALAEAVAAAFPAGR